MYVCNLEGEPKIVNDEGKGIKIKNSYNELSSYMKQKLAKIDAAGCCNLLFFSCV